MAASNTHRPSEALRQPLDPMMPFRETWRASTIDLPLVLWSETLRFMGHRLQAQADHLSAFVHCRTVPEALESQAAFTRETLSDYVAEAGTMMREARSVVKLPEKVQAPIAA